MNYKKLWPTLKQTFSAWSGHEAPTLGAALAFYTILSLAPLVILVISIVALIYRRSTAQAELLAQVQNMIGQQGADAVRAMIEHAQKPATGVLACIIGVITLLYGASGAFNALRSALNRMWDVEPKKAGGCGG
jgi:membrane protein